MYIYTIFDKKVRMNRIKVKFIQIFDIEFRNEFFSTFSRSMQDVVRYTYDLKIGEHPKIRFTRETLLAG